MYLHVENKQVQYHWPTFVPDVEIHAYEIPMMCDLICVFSAFSCVPILSVSPST